VLVPTPVPCVAEAPAKPKRVTDAELKRMSDYQLPKALARDRQQSTAYIGELEAVVEGCSRLRP
jgi:hypothetical protein